MTASFEKRHKPAGKWPSLKPKQEFHSFHHYIVMRIVLENYNVGTFHSKQETLLSQDPSLLLQTAREEFQKTPDGPEVKT